MKRDMNIIMLAANKGGVTKTSTSFMLSSLFASDSHKKILKYDYRRVGGNTLVIDLDRQANVSKTLLNDQYDPSGGSVMDAIGTGDASPFIVKVDKQEKLFVLPATKALDDFEDDYYENLSNLDNPFKLLESSLEKVVVDLDIKNIIIDSAPSINKILLMGLGVSFGNKTNVIIPFPLDRYGADSILDTAEAIEAVQGSFNPNATIMGLLPALVDSNTKRDEVYLEQVKDVYGELVIDFVVARRTAIKDILEDGFSEEYIRERNALKMYYKIFNEVKRRLDS